MKITKVVYELFETDFSLILGNENSEEHAIDREVGLVMDDGPKIFVSWTDKPEQYSVGYQHASYFKNDPEKIIDVSDWKIWKPIINQDCEFIFQTPDHQILELKASKTSVYFSSQEGGSWYADVINISTSKPKFK